MKFSIVSGGMMVAGQASDKNSLGLLLDTSEQLTATVYNITSLRGGNQDIVEVVPEEKIQIGQRYEIRMAKKERDLLLTLELQGTRPQAGAKTETQLALEVKGIAEKEARPLFPAGSRQHTGRIRYGYSGWGSCCLSNGSYKVCALSLSFLDNGSKFSTPYSCDAES